MFTHRITLVAAFVAIQVAGAGMAQDSTTKRELFSLQRMLPATAENGRKALQKEPFGAVTINERALALPVQVQEYEDKRLSIHSDIYEYYFVPVTFGVTGFDGHQVKSFLIEISVPDRRAADGDAWLVDVFPRLETVAGRLSAETNVTITGDLKIDATTPALPVAQGNATVNGKSKLSWKYNPVFQSFSAVFSEATAMWSFDKVADEVKAGPIDLRLLIAVRKEGRVAKRSKLDLTSRIRAEFSGFPLFGGRSAATSDTIVVEF
ncbi:MAG: hypothetical protein ABJV68_05185 [Paracoccaceae bacterium]